MKRIVQIATVLCLVTLGSARLSAEAKNDAGTVVYIGTQGEGILGARLDPKSGRLSLIGTLARIDRPTWLAIDPDRPVLYAVSELGNYTKETGRVISMSIDRATGALHEISNVDSAGG